MPIIPSSWRKGHNFNDLFKNARFSLLVFAGSDIFL